MSSQLLKDSLSIKIATNVLLKSKFLCFFFGIIFIVQIVSIVFLRNTGAFQVLLSNDAIFLGPLLIAVMIIGQFYFIKLAKEWLRTGIIIHPLKLYLLLVIEVSFPCFILFFLCSLLKESTVIGPIELLNSPLLVIIFIFIILSALYLDFKVSLISSIVPAIQYCLISMYFLPSGTPMYFSGISKGILMIVAGLISGVISKKIQEGVKESVESKNLLINELDRLVQEKTAVLTQQKKELEVKQKEIVDSITYASRIQNALMTPENYIEKNLNKLQDHKKNKN